MVVVFFFQAEDGIRDGHVTGVQTCALPICADELVVITKNGKPVAVLLPMEDDDELERLALAYSRRFQAILHEAREQIRTTGGIPHDDFWREVEAESNQQTPAQDNAA